MSSLISIPNGGDAVIAEYKGQFIEEYRGNPFIEALPPIYSKLDVVDKLSVYPKYDVKERLSENHIRVHMVQRLFQCFQPLEIHLDMESRISRVIRQGYLARNPIRPTYASSLQEGFRLIHNMNSDLSKVFRSSAAGFTMIGISGMGKTTAINRILSTLPQIIAHSEYNGIPFMMYQLTWLKLDCPYDGSIKGLCIEFFSEVDRLLGTNYYKKHVTGRQTVDIMLSVMSQVASNIGLGILVIDEIQHLNQAKSGGDERMLNFFVTLVNTINLPVTLIGTTKAMSVLQSEFRQARRGSGQGDFVIKRLQKDESWELLLEALWGYQWTKKETPLSEELSSCIYECSQGIIDIAVKLYAMAQIRAILSETEEVTIELIRQVSNEDLKLVHPMIEALKSGDFRRISRFEDICSADLGEFMSIEKPRCSPESQLKEQMMKKKQKETASNISFKENVAQKLLVLNFEPAKIQKVINEILNENTNDADEAGFIIKAIQMLTAESKKKLVKRKKITQKSEEDIRVVVEEGRKMQMTAYEALKSKGYIKDADDFSAVG